MENFFKATLDFFVTVADTIANVFVGLGKIISFNFQTIDVVFVFLSFLPEVLAVIAVLCVAVSIIYLIVGR